MRSIRYGSSWRACPFCAAPRSENPGRRQACGQPAFALTLDAQSTCVKGVLFPRRGERDTLSDRRGPTRRRPSNHRIRTLFMTSVSLDQAAAIVDGALAVARSEDLMPLTVAVLDSGGHLVALKREDGSGIMRPQIAVGKAWAALGMGASSRALAGSADRPSDLHFRSDRRRGRPLRPGPGRSADPRREWRRARRGRHQRRRLRKRRALRRPRGQSGGLGPRPGRVGPELARRRPLTEIN